MLVTHENEFRRGHEKETHSPARSYRAMRVEHALTCQKT